MEAALAYLIAFWLKGLLHGMYLTIFLYWLCMPKDRQTLFFTVTTWMAFVFTNIDAGICCALLFEGFWGTISTGGPIPFFATSSDWQFLWQEYNYLALILVSDALMVYRVWRLWEQWRWIVMIPGLLLVGETALRLLGATYMAVDGTADALFLNTTTASLVLNTALQVAITVLLGYRLLVQDDIRLLPPEQRSRRFRITRAIVESGVVISLGLALNLAFFIRSINIHWTFNIMLPHLYSITSLAIVVRLRLARRMRKDWETRTRMQTTRGHSTTVWPESPGRSAPDDAVDEDDATGQSKPYGRSLRTLESMELRQKPVVVVEDTDTPTPGTTTVFIRKEVTSHGSVRDV